MLKSAKPANVEYLNPGNGKAEREQKGGSAKIKSEPKGGGVLRCMISPARTNEPAAKALLWKKNKAQTRSFKTRNKGTKSRKKGHEEAGKGIKGPRPEEKCSYPKHGEGTPEIAEAGKCSRMKKE